MLTEGWRTIHVYIYMYISHRDIYLTEEALWESTEPRAAHDTTHLATTTVPEREPSKGWGTVPLAPSSELASLSHTTALQEIAGLLHAWVNKDAYGQRRHTQEP